MSNTIDAFKFDTPEDYPYTRRDTPRTVQQAGLFGSGLTEGPQPELVRTPGGEAMRSNLWKLVTETPDLPGANRFDDAGGDLAMRFIAGDTFQDPRSSPLWAGLRDEMRREEESGVNAMRRYAQKGGMLRSGSHFGQEGDYRATMADKRMSTLGGLYERERDRNSPQSRLAAALQYAGNQRGIDMIPYRHDYQVRPALMGQAAGSEQLRMPEYSRIPSWFETGVGAATDGVNLLTGIKKIFDPTTAPEPSSTSSWLGPAMQGGAEIGTTLLGLI